MKKIVVILFAMLLMCASATASVTKTLTLEKSNTLAIRGPITSSSVSKLQHKLFKKSNKLNKDDNIFLVLDTPGGSITSGMELINTAKAIPQRVVTVSKFSASMGFIIAQYLGPRVITPGGILMSHKAKLKISGETPGEFENRKRLFDNIIKDIRKVNADRLRLSVSEYKNLIKNEYWTYGNKAVKQKAVDAKFRVKCGKSFEGIKKETLRTIFGEVVLTFSQCPLISSPLKIDYSGINFFKMDDSEEKKFRNIINMMYSNKVRFVEKFVSNGKDLEILK